MDDVLVCAPNDDLLSHALDLTIDSLVAAGFKLQEEKIQRMPPWKYLGLEIGEWTIVPQKLAVKNNTKTLADVQQVCGSLNWEDSSVGGERGIGYGIKFGEKPKTNLSLVEILFVDERKIQTVTVSSIFDPALQ
ncbi:hypothetical protein DUI87_22358 [Hirundo rustica rustica]|uniref:ribonuclease H n=1 Tax=Hirundo rustica rustica TaxID=333673 RepID=A0A3M0JIZ2_HIRRU|nr:hypothetical protein DUI87_22358 [Hirundo rustica rustica]